MHTELRKYKKPGPKYQLVDIMNYVSIFTKNVYTYLFTKKKCISVQLSQVPYRDST